MGLDNRAPIGLMIIVAVATLSACAGTPAATRQAATATVGASPGASASPSLVPALTTAPTALPSATSASDGTDKRAVLDFGGQPSDDRIVLGRLTEGGDYEVVALLPSEEPFLVGAIRAIASRVPQPWRLADPKTAAAVSDTGFLVLTVLQGPAADVNVGLAVFDLGDPTASPRILPSPDGGFRLAGDRLWVATDDDVFAVYDLPSAASTVVRVPGGSNVVRGGRVPFSLAEAGDAVLIEGNAAGLRLLEMTGEQRPLGEQPLLLTTGRESPFGSNGRELGVGADCAASTVQPADLCVVGRNGSVLGYSVPGSVIDVAWDPGEDQPVWVTTKGLGVVHGGTPQRIVRVGAWKPSSIAGFWSNVALLASVDEPQVAVALVGPDSMTALPMPADSIVPLPGDVVLRVVRSDGP